MRQRWATRWLIAVGLCGMLVCSGVQAAAAQAQTVPAIAAAERVVGRSIPTRDEPRRPGDPPQLVAAIEAAALGTAQLVIGTHAIIQG